jgi:SAM-dependent methyltransferase
VSANHEQVRYWNEEGADQWVTRQDLLDRMLAVFLPPLLAAVAAAPGDHVLDVGCGSGATTLELARIVGPDGRVMGLDVSRPLLDRLQERAASRGLANVLVRDADAQVAQLPAGHFDAVASRFGVMFFDDPVAAFSNLARATKPGGRLAFVCWQPADRNPWFAEPLAAAMAVLPDAGLPPPGSPGPFALSNPERVCDVLRASGFDAMTVESLTVDLDSGTPGEAAAFTVNSTMVRRLAGDAGDAVKEAVGAAIRAVMDRNQAPDGHVRMAGAAWLVTAHRP